MRSSKSWVTYHLLERRGINYGCPKRDLFFIFLHYKKGRTECNILLSCYTPLHVDICLALVKIETCVFETSVMLHYNVCNKMMEKGRNMWDAKCFFPSGLSRPKRVCLKQVSCFTTMYVVKWWRREETFGIPHVSSLLHHFITYIVVKHDTCFKHTRFSLDKPFSIILLHTL